MHADIPLTSNESQVSVLYERAQCTGDMCSDKCQRIGQSCSQIHKNTPRFQPLSPPSRKHKLPTYRIGPDPASIDSAMIGGIVANNSSGMCCGVDQNTYKTLADMRMVLGDGTVLDTTDPESCNKFLEVGRGKGGLAGARKEGGGGRI